jgi:hypothetical protein
MITDEVYWRILSGSVLCNVYCYAIIFACRLELQNHMIDHNQIDTARVHLLDKFGRSQPHLNCGWIRVIFYVNISRGNIFTSSVTVYCLLPNMHIYYTTCESFEVVFTN